MLVTSSCVSSPPEKPDNICEIFEERGVGIKQQSKQRRNGSFLPMF